MCRQLTLLSLSCWKAVGMEGSRTIFKREVTGRAHEFLVANDELSIAPMSEGKKLRFHKGQSHRNTLGQELAIFFTLRETFIFLETVIYVL